MLGLFLLTVLGCEDDPGNAQIVRTPSAETARDWTSNETSLDLQWFARASLDIRGVRPSVEELQWATSNPDSLADILESWLDEPEFAHQQAWYWNDLLHTAVWIGQEERFESMLFTPQEAEAIGWEPLSYIEQTILSDAPFTNIVTTSAVPTNEVLAGIFADDSENVDWGMHTLDRNHPSAGLLASRVLWTRHFVDFLNHNRARANFYSSTFLCQDFLERDVAFDFSQVSLDNVETAIQTQPECVTCHASLDPLASVFGAFQENINLGYDQQGVASSFKQRWYAGLTEPSYFGLPLNNLSDLGTYTASDMRFAQCMVQKTWDFFSPGVDLDGLEKIDLTSVFVASNYSMKQLVQHIVQSPEYVEQTARILRPEQLWGTILSLGQMDQSESSLRKIVWSPEHRVLFGSTDDIGVLSANTAFTVGHHMTLEWIVNELSEVIELDLLTQNIEERQLLIKLQESTQQGRLEQVLYWKRTLHSEYVDPSDGEVEALMNLWNNVDSTSGEVVAWSTVLAVLLHDARAVLR